MTDSHSSRLSDITVFTHLMSPEHVSQGLGAKLDQKILLYQKFLCHPLSSPPSLKTA